ASEWVMFTLAAKPTTDTPPAPPDTTTTSSPLVPLTITVSGCPSPAVPPRAPARSRFTSVTSVPDRSLTVILSAPLRAATLTCSTPLTSMVTLPRSSPSTVHQGLPNRSQRRRTNAPAQRPFGPCLRGSWPRPSNDQSIHTLFLREPGFRPA